MEPEFMDGELLRGFALGIGAAIAIVCVAVLALVDGQRLTRRRRGRFGRARGGTSISPERPKDSRTGSASR